MENYFGRHRSMGRSRDNPNLRTFGYQDNANPIKKTLELFRAVHAKMTAKFWNRYRTLPFHTNKRKSEVL